MQAGWRPMRSSDLPTVLEIADQVHPDYPESGLVFASRLVLFPAGCFMAEDATHPLGYCVAHPGKMGDPPPLNAVVPLPGNPDCLYLHDMALLPEARGHRLGEAMVGQLMAVAREHRFDRMALTAVSNSWRFWERHGFHRYTCAKAAEYGPTALYMVKVIPQSGSMNHGTAQGNLSPLARVMAGMDRAHEKTGFGRHGHATPAEITMSRIRARAREIWEREGRPDGRDLVIWLRAETEVVSEDCGLGEDSGL